jgi:hypothetical protein
LPGKILSSSSFISNQWYYSNIEILGATSKTHKPANYGIYKLRVDSTNGCSTFSNDFDFKYTSVNENNLPESIKIYPNPTNGMFFIVSEIAWNYTVYDYNGKEILSGYKEKGSEHLDLSNFASGVYLLKLVNENEQITTKIIRD